VNVNVRTRVVGVRVTENDYQRLEEIAAGRPLSDVVREAMLSRLSAGSPSPAMAPTTPPAGPDPTSSDTAGSFSDNPDPSAAANGAGEKALDDSPGVDVGEGMTPVRPGGGGAGSGALDALRVAISEELPSGLAVDRSVLADALHASGIATLDDAGGVVLEVGGQRLPLAEALNLPRLRHVLLPTGGPGSGRGAPRDLGEIPAPKSVIERAVGSQAYFEAHRDKVEAEERRVGLGQR
jgi:hypothetical protein